MEGVTRWLHAEGLFSTLITHYLFFYFPALCCISLTVVVLLLFFSVFIIKRTGLMASVLLEALPVYFDFRISVGMLSTEHIPSCFMAKNCVCPIAVSSCVCAHNSLHSTYFCHLFLVSPSQQRKQSPWIRMTSSRSKIQRTVTNRSENCGYIALRHCTLWRCRLGHSYRRNIIVGNLLDFTLKLFCDQTEATVHTDDLETLQGLLKELRRSHLIARKATLDTLH